MGKIKLPTSWGDVTLKKYIEITEFQAVDMDELDKSVKILSILSDKTEDEILDISLPDIKECIKRIQFIYTTPEEGKIKQKIKINGHRYFINLNVRSITGAEYIDFTSLLKEKDKITQNLTQILPIFLKPVNIFGFKKKKCYRINDKNEEVQTLESRAFTSKLILDNLTMDIVFNLSGFFLRNYQALTKATLDCIIKENSKKRELILRKMKKEGFKNTGAGF